MTGLGVAVGILLFYAFAVWAVKHEEELKELWKDAWKRSGEIVERLLGRKEEEEEEE